MRSPGRSFRRWGVAGFVAACAIAELLARRDRLDLGTEAALIVAAVATFFAVAWVTRAVTGIESLTYYHHEIAVLAVVAAAAAALGAPVRPHLDATALGLGMFLVFGRIGCLRVGCCHGRAARRGVRYGGDQVRDGFPTYLEDVPLIPVQAIESGAVAAIVLIGALVVFDPHDPGLALCFYVAAYAVVRLALEELRGDTDRRYLRGLSEAQWTSLAVIAAVLGAGAAGIVPGVGIGLAGAALALLELAVIGLLRRRRTSAPLDPEHVREFRELARAAIVRRDLGPGPIPVWVTGAGVMVSTGVTGGRRHYTLSRERVPLTASDAERLAEIIRAATGEGADELIAGPAATFHLVTAGAER